MPLGRIIFGQGGLIAMKKTGDAFERIAEMYSQDSYESFEHDPDFTEDDSAELPAKRYPEENALVPVETYNIFDQNPEEQLEGGDNEMTELESDYFQERGEFAVQAAEGDSADDYSDEELEAYGVALDLWLAENGEIEEVSSGDIAAYAQDQGLLPAVMDAKETYQDQLEIDGLYDEVVDQTEERAGDAGHAAIQISQLEYFVDRMSEGTERVAQAHEDTESTYDELRSALSSGADTMDTAVDRLLSAADSKGVDMGQPEDLDRDVDYLQTLDQSIEDAADELERRQEEGEDLDIDRLRELEEQTEDRVGMSEELDRLE